MWGAPALRLPLCLRADPRQPAGDGGFVGAVGVAEAALDGGFFREEVAGRVPGANVPWKMRNRRRPLPG